jgi:hypothetical protein
MVDVYSPLWWTFIAPYGGRLYVANVHHKYYPVSTAIQAHEGRIMAMPKKKAENDVIKASAAIQISGKITLLQRRAWNVLLANAMTNYQPKIAILSTL